MNRICHSLLLHIVVCSLAALCLVGCTENLFVSRDSQEEYPIHRYDLLESRYLTTNDYSALQQMKTRYVLETRVLIENLLCIGTIDTPGINVRLTQFYSDSTLSRIVKDVEIEFLNMDKENEMLRDAFDNMQDIFPDVELPQVYTLIGDLGQSVIVSGNKVGISLDKYLGANYPIYAKYYSEEQRKQMTREYIVPDCLGIYLLSQFPLKDFQHASQYERDFHVQCIWKVVNKILGFEFFKGDSTPDIDKYLATHKEERVEEILLKYKKKD